MAFKDIGPAEFVRSSARRLGRLVAQRRVSPVQLAECAIGLAKKLEPQLNAYVMFLEDYARKGAAALEAEARKGRLRGPLHGVPIAIKDNFYLKVHPGTCLAAWVAIDPADRENGGLNVVPGSHDMDLFCPEEADPEVSFTREFVPVPSGLVPVSPNLSAGDVLFFGGNLIHGSEPNRTSDRFRRSFICHYLGESARELSRWYRPIYRFDGTEVSVDDATGGGPCGDVVVAGPH